MAEPAAKKQKTDVSDGGEKTELEQDAKADSRPKLRDPVSFFAEETTLNILPSSYGGMLVPLTDGGLQYLLAGARASVGVNAGRYCFEVKIVEYVNPPEEPQAKNRQPGPRNYLRIGLSTAGSSLFLGDGEDNVCFDTDGNFIHGKQKTAALGGQKLGRDEVIAIVVNLTQGHPNTNTVSLFRDGQRLSEPQPLPANLKGKELYPTLTFRNLIVHYNFGPALEAPLPFKCRMWHEAAQKDCQVTMLTLPPRDGKYEVLFPVCLPDEGSFDWLDLFLEKNPQYTEISDRAIISWAEKSGIARPKGYGPTSKSSNDKPEYGFNLPLMDDLSVRRIIQMVAPLQNRSFIVMEVRGNLIKDERREAVSKWCPASFRRIAVVLFGEPSVAFKKRSQELYLKQKQEASDEEHKKKMAELSRKRILEKRQKELEKAKKIAEKERKRAEEAIRRKVEMEKLKRETEARGETFVEPEEEKKDEEPDEEDKDEPEELEEEPPPKVELTPEDKKLWFRKPLTPDLSAYALSTSFTKFSAPDREDGFDEIRHDWQKADKCKDYVKNWIQERKLTTRIEDITPSDWFNDKWKLWQKSLQSWHAKQTAYKGEQQKKLDEAAAKEAARKAKQEAKEAREKAVAEAKARGETPPEAPEEDKMDEDDQEETQKEKDTTPKVDFDKLDVFGVEEFLDVGDKQPLFSNFLFEDWTMMSLRFELHLLVNAFRKDANDSDRPGIHADHLSFYYNKYYKKQLNPKFFGVETIRQLVELIRDTVVCTRGNVCEAQLPDDLESLGIFVMLTEEARRDRIRRIDLGDESARLNIMQPGLGGAAMVGMAQNARPVIQLGAARPQGTVIARPTGGVTVGAVATGVAAAATQAWQAKAPQTWPVRPAAGSTPVTFPAQSARPFQPNWPGWRPTR